MQRKRNIRALAEGSSGNKRKRLSWTSRHDGINDAEKAMGGRVQKVHLTAHRGFPAELIEGRKVRDSCLPM